MRVLISTRTRLLAVGAVAVFAVLTPVQAQAASSTIYDTQGDLAYVAGGVSYSSTRSSGDIKKVTVTHSDTITIRMDFASLQKSSGETHFFPLSITGSNGVNITAYMSAGSPDWYTFGTYDPCGITYNLNYTYDYAIFRVNRACLMYPGSIKVKTGIVVLQSSTSARYVDDAFNKYRAPASAATTSCCGTGLVWSNYVAYNK